MKEFPVRLIRIYGLAVVIGSLLSMTACMVGPKYRRPAAPVPQSFKEAPPQGWKEAQPNEGVLRGKWWEVYGDSRLNAYEEQVNISNQNVRAALAQYQQARDTVRIARSNYFPTISAAPSVTNAHTSSTLAAKNLVNFVPGTHTEYTLPVDISYQADVWGSIRRGVSSAAEEAQASAALLENARLTYQAQLAQTYFQLHGVDGDVDLLQKTVNLYGDYLQLTKEREDVGVASDLDVQQAETQLESARAQLVDFGVLRAQYEHAIAILTGKPPAELTIELSPIDALPPPVPIGLPSALLERRPDVAAAERHVASSNEQIGIAKAALYPALNFSATGGFQTTDASQIVSWPSRFWSVGPHLAQTLFSGGRLHAQLKYQQDAYDNAAANYRQTVLTAFQQVEDQLAALRVLEDEAAVDDRAVKAAEASLEIATEQYKAGTANYLQVISAQTAALQTERAAVDILTRRMTASVLLIEALGGGWDASQLPGGR
jgi:NodT family efflux transporter outer membrane factor (OMF) lipoprotein